MLISFQSSLNGIGKAQNRSPKVSFGAVRLDAVENAIGSQQEFLVDKDGKQEICKLSGQPQPYRIPETTVKNMAQRVCLTDYDPKKFVKAYSMGFLYKEENNQFAKSPSHGVLFVQYLDKIPYVINLNYPEAADPLQPLSLSCAKKPQITKEKLVLRDNHLSRVCHLEQPLHLDQSSSDKLDLPEFELMGMARALNVQNLDLSQPITAYNARLKFDDEPISKEREPLYILFVQNNQILNLLKPESKPLNQVG